MTQAIDSSEALVVLWITIIIKKRSLFISLFVVRSVHAIYAWSVLKAYIGCKQCGYAESRQTLNQRVNKMLT